MRQAPDVGRSSSSSVVRPPTQKKKEIVARLVRRVKTLPPTSPSSPSVSSSSSSSFSFSFSDGPQAGVDRVVPPIICEEEDEE